MHAHPASRRTAPIRLRALFLLLFVPAACGGIDMPESARSSSPAGATATATATAPAKAGIPAFKHVVIVVFENKELSQIIGSRSAPYISALAAQYAYARNYFAIRHPSLPNYLALTGGQTFGVTDDCTACFLDAESIASQLEAAGRSWKAYMDGMPRACFTGNAGRYVQKHNPFIYYDTIRTDPRRCNKIVPFAEFEDDLAANTLPDFAWITPDACHDMHDCSVQEGDSWLQSWLPALLASPAWKDDGVVFLTFDEGSTQAGCCRYAVGGRVLALAISPLARPGYVSDTPYDHYSLLRTVEEAFGLPPLGNAACDCSPLMSDLFITAAASPRGP